MSTAQGHLKIPVGPDDHVQGGAEAAVTLVEYGDYECPYCGDAYPIVKQMQKRMGAKLRFVFRNFPLAEAHPYATAAAEMAEAAALQGKFWEMHDTLYEHQQALESDDLAAYARALHLDLAKLKTDLASHQVTARVRSDFVGGVRSGVNGTPSFFVNGVRFDGNWTDAREFLEALQKAAVG